MLRALPRRRCLPAAVLVLAVGLAGCGGDDGDVVTDGSSTSSSTTVGATTTSSGTGSTTTSTGAATSTTVTTAPATTTTLAPDETTRVDATEDVLGLFEAAPTAATAPALAELVVDVLTESVAGVEADVPPTVQLVGITGSGPAVAVIRIDGLPDDAVRGFTVVVSMAATGGTWSVTGVQRSDRCARDVTADGTLCV